MSRHLEATSTLYTASGMARYTCAWVLGCDAF